MDEAKQVRRVVITTGIADSLFTEIDEGKLKEGDTVILGIETPEEQAQRKLPPGFDGGTRMR
jgi:multidrug efflux pump subunit AcrA (membrane-fusion protein)